MLWAEMARKIDQLTEAQHGIKCVIVAHGTAAAVARGFSHWAVSRLGRAWLEMRVSTLVYSPSAPPSPLVWMHKRATLISAMPPGLPRVPNDRYATCCTSAVHRGRAGATARLPNASQAVCCTAMPLCTRVLCGGTIDGCARGVILRGGSRA